MKRLGYAGACLLASVAFATAVAHGQETGAGAAAGVDADAAVGVDAAAQPGVAPDARIGTDIDARTDVDARARADLDARGRARLDAPMRPGFETRGRVDAWGQDEFGMEHQPGELGVFMVPIPGAAVEITAIRSGSAAEEAGLEPGDVILAIEDFAVQEPLDVQELIRETPAGETVSLVIWRDGFEHEVEATLQPLAEREPYRVGFREAPIAIAGELEARTMELEELLSMVTQELRMLRQEVTQLRTARRDQPARLNGLDAREEAPRDGPALDPLEEPRTLPQPEEPEEREDDAALDY